MRKIDLKGIIISNDYKWIYDKLKMQSTCPTDVISGLEAAKGEDIEISINSGGGSVFAGYEIYNAITEYKGKVVIKIVGLAASAASFISQAPNAKVYMSPLSQMMIHNAATVAEGNHNAMDDASKMLKVTDTTIAKAYVLKSGQPEDKIRELMEEETWFTSEQAKELGLIDGILLDSKTEPRVSNSVYNTIPLDNSLLHDLEKCVTEEQVDKLIADRISNTGTKYKENKGNSKEKMTLDRVKSEYPDLYNQLVNDAKDKVVQEERERIKSINALAKPGVEDQIKKGIEDGLDVGQVAINILNAQTVLNQAAWKSMTEDAAFSGVNNVNTSAMPQGSNAKDQEDSINLLVNAAKAINGGNR